MFLHPAAVAVVLAAVALAPAARSDRVGVVWHRQATVSPAAQQRLTQEVARELGLEPEQVVGDAQIRAQRLVAHAVDPDDARDLADLAGRLEAATALFRGGELDLARSQASAVLQQLRRAPHLPGAARLAWQTHMLFARVAWTAGDTGAAEAALGRAVILDPDAGVSTRRVPPDLAALYETQRASITAQRDRWVRPELGIDLDGAQVELDGRVGLRPLPPGEHFVVVRWLGAPPAAGVLGGAAPTLTRPSARIPSGLPVRGPQAQRICDELELGQLVLARIRGGRLGLHTFRCGGGYGDVFYSEGAVVQEATWTGVEVAVPADAPASAFRRKRSPLLDDKPWPQTAPTTAPEISRRGDTTTDVPPKKPWYRRAWIWVLVGAVVVGGVTTGAVLGTREPNRVISADIEDWTGR